MASLYVLVTSLLYSILLICIYFYKQRLNSLENKLFVSLMLTNLAGLLLDIGCIITVSNMEIIPLINTIVTKTYLVYLFTWVTLFTWYVFVITKGNDKKSNHFQNNKKFLVAFFAIVVLIIYIVPLNYVHDSNGMYSYGFGTNLLYFITFVYYIVWITRMISNYKNLKSKKYLPIFLFLILGFVVMIIQRLNPYMLLMTSMETFVTFLMYFTIENPDLQMLREFQKSKEYIEKTNNEKTMFLLNISKEIRTPLKQIEVSCERALAEEDINYLKEDIRKVSKYSKGLLNIINNVLDTSNKTSSFKSYKNKYSTKILFKEIINATKLKLNNEQINFMTMISEDIPDYLYGDSIHFKEVIDSILNNAIKYTSKGFIELNASCINKHDECRLIIFIEDSGIGMDAEQMESIFSTDKSLGKAKKIMTNLGGTIMVNSEVGKGSKFTIILDQKIVGNENSLEKLTRDYINNNRILIVSNYKRDINMFKKLSYELKIDVDSVDLGIKSLEKAHKNKYILILIDEDIPKLNAYETLDKLKQYDDIKAPIAILSKTKDDDEKKMYLKKGFNYYIQKPLEKEKIKEILETIIKNNS